MVISDDDDDDECPDEARIIRLCDTFMAAVADNAQRGPKTNIRIFEALEALAFTAVTLVKANEYSSCLTQFFTRRFAEELNVPEHDGETIQ